MDHIIWTNLLKTHIYWEDQLGPTRQCQLHSFTLQHQTTQCNSAVDVEENFTYISNKKKCNLPMGVHVFREDIYDQTQIFHEIENLLINSRQAGVPSTTPSYCLSSTLPYLSWSSYTSELKRTPTEVLLPHLPERYSYHTYQRVTLATTARGTPTTPGREVLLPNLPEVLLSLLPEVLLPHLPEVLLSHLLEVLLPHLPES